MTNSALLESSKIALWVLTSQVRKLPLAIFVPCDASTFPLAMACFVCFVSGSRKITSLSEKTVELPFLTSTLSLKVKIFASGFLSNISCPLDWIKVFSGIGVSSFLVISGQVVFSVEVCAVCVGLSLDRKKRSFLMPSISISASFLIHIFLLVRSISQPCPVIFTPFPLMVTESSVYTSFLSGKYLR